MMPNSGKPYSTGLLSTLFGKRGKIAEKLQEISDPVTGMEKIRRGFLYKNRKTVAVALEEIDVESVTELPEKALIAAAEYYCNQSLERCSAINQGNIRTQFFNETVHKLLLYSAFSEAEQLIDEVIAKGHFDSNHRRITYARNALRDVRNHVEDCKRRSTLPGCGLIDVELYGAQEFFPFPEQFDGSTPEGAYLRTIEAGPVAVGADLKIIFEENRERFSEEGFFTKPHFTEGDIIHVVKDARVSYTKADGLSLLDSRNRIHPRRSGGNARRSSVSAAMKSRDRLPSAFVLPFPYTAQNYYHTLYEQYYALKFLDLIPQEALIIHGPDRFNIMPAMADFLGIDKRRFLSAEEASPKLIGTAFAPEYGPYNWSGNVHSFFRNLIANRLDCDNPRKIFISRRGTRRTPSYEELLESDLEQLGFAVLRMEDMPLMNQFRIFAGADVIAGFHGAGFANMLFSSTESTVIELFEESYVCADYAHKSKYITTSYYPMIIDKDYRSRDRLKDAVQGILAVSL